jgi:Domain of unknown function (DUF4386)
VPGLVHPTRQGREGSWLVNALACIGTAIAPFPVVKRQNESAALGFVASRVLEAAVIMIGVVSLLVVVTLRQDLAGGVWIVVKGFKPSPITRCAIPVGARHASLPVA